MIENKKILERMSNTCPKSQKHVFNNNVCKNCGFDRSWTYNDRNFVKYINTYEKKINPRLIKIDVVNYQLEKTDSNKEINASIQNNSTMFDKLLSSYKNNKEIINKINIVMEMSNKGDNIRSFINFINNVVFFNENKSSITIYKTLRNNIPADKMKNFMKQCIDDIDYKKIKPRAVIVHQKE